MSYKLKIIIAYILYLVILDYFVCTEFVDSLEKIINGGYNEDEFNPLFVEELNEIKDDPENKKKDNFYVRLRSGQWFALKQQVDYDSSEMGPKRVYGVLPVNPFAGNIFTPSLSEIELADQYCEALLEMRNKGISAKIGLKIAKDGLIRQKFCSDAAELYFNGLRPRPATVAQKQNEIESLGNIEYLDSPGIETIAGQIDILAMQTGAIPRHGGKYGPLSSQEAELITKQTLLRNFLHIVKQLHLNTLRKDPLRLREYFPGTLLQLRDAIESDDPEVVAVRLLRLGPTSDLLEQFINNHRGRRDLLLLKTSKKDHKKRSRIFDEWMTLLTNTDLSTVTLPTLEYLAYKHVALTPSIKTQIKKLYDLIVKEKGQKQNYLIHHIIDAVELLPDVVKAEIRIYFELNTKHGYNRVNTLEKIRSMIGVIQPLIKTVNHFSEEEINKILANTGLKQNELNYFSRNISKILLTILERRRLKIKENDDDDDLLNDEPSISVNSMIEMIQQMNNSSLGAIMDHIENVVPNFTNKNMYSEATEKQKKEILALIKLPSSHIVSKQLYNESILRPLLADAIPNEYGIFDKFIKGFYILMAETGIRLQLYLRNGLEEQIPNEYEEEHNKNKVFLEDNLRHSSELWLDSIQNLLEESLFPYELATRRLLQYIKECKIGLKFGYSEEELNKRSSEIDQSYLQKLLDNFESVKLTEKKLNPIFIGEKGNMLILPNRRHHLINYIFQKDGGSLYRILKGEKLDQVLIGLVDLLEEIQIPKKEEVNIQGPYWDREKNEWINAEKMRNNEVDVIYEPQKVTDLPINREQEWERIALFSKWSEFVKGIPINSIPNGFKFSFGLYSNFIHYCQRGIRELAYRLIVRDKPTNTEPEGKYWEYLPRNKYSISINADNSKAREEKVLSFCSAVYISIYSEKGVPKEFKGSLPNVWSKETDEYEKEGFITPKDKSKQLRYYLDDVNEQWSFIASEARKPGIFTAPTLPADSSLLGDVWRKLYVDQHIATSSVNEVDTKISILTDMCSKAIKSLKQKKNYYGEQLYKMVYDGENSIEIFCHDVSRRWFSQWPSDISYEMLLSSQPSDNENQSFKPFDRSYLKSKNPTGRKIREGFSTKEKKISPVVKEEFNFKNILRKAHSADNIPSELCDESVKGSCNHRAGKSSVTLSTSSINLASGRALINSADFKRPSRRVKDEKNKNKNSPGNALSINKMKNIGEIIGSPVSSRRDQKLSSGAIPKSKVKSELETNRKNPSTKNDKTFSELID